MMYTENNFNPESLVVADTASSAGTRLRPEQIDSLLNRLAEDGEFRIRFHADPTGALNELGIIGIAPSFWRCMQGRAMPPAEVFRTARDTLRKQLMSDAAYYMFKLDC